MAYHLSWLPGFIRHGEVRSGDSREQLPVVDAQRAKRHAGALRRAARSGEDGEGQVKGTAYSPWEYMG